jgi:hypothetical protein
MRDDPGTGRGREALVYYPAQNLHGKGHLGGNLEVYLADVSITYASSTGG